MKRNPKIEAKFQEAILNRLKNEWVSLVPRNNLLGFYFQTFMVVRIDKATTKYRLIMNGAYCSNRRSINDYLLTGPSRMNCVWDVLAWSGRGLSLLACDVESMFLNIRVDKEQEDPKFLSTLFQDPQTEEVRAMQCNSHIFGLTQSPYVAMEVVRCHA